MATLTTGVSKSTNIGAHVHKEQLSAIKLIKLLPLDATLVNNIGVYIVCFDEHRKLWLDNPAWPFSNPLQTKHVTYSEHTRAHKYTDRFLQELLRQTFS